MHPKLSHLTTEQYDEVLRKYYDPEKTLTVTEIIKEYDIDVRAGDFLSLFPLRHHDEACIHCDYVSLVSKLPSRSSPTSIQLYCPNCNHKHLTYCRCRNCLETIREQQIENELFKRELIYESFGLNELHVPSVGELSLKTLLYFKACITHSVSEEFEYVFPYSPTQINFAPTYKYRNEIIKYLYRQNLVVPCPDSDLSAFVFNDEHTETTAYYPAKVNWLLLPNLNTAERLNFIADIDTHLNEYAENQDVHEHELEIWHEIIKNEALEYYEHKLSEVYIHLDKIGEKTYSVFYNLSNRFSVAQIYQLVFTTVRDTNHYGIQKDIPKYRLKNMFIGALERKADKYEAEGWLKEYRRDFDCPQSTLSALFFDGYLKVGGEYFTTPIPI